ncbi:hypothetical protein [Halopelagius fulvigenes]|uniref:Uncharacterized protein n=1 Tax=Halopelagius fulvigenes TaxID=1198324 RepID=A0ABD5U3L0_9EURY
MVDPRDEETTVQLDTDSANRFSVEDEDLARALVAAYDAISWANGPPEASDSESADDDDAADDAETEDFDAEAFIDDAWQSVVSAIEDGNVDAHLDAVEDAEESRESPRDSVLKAVEGRR